jgi:hypothetical protein
MAAKTANDLIHRTIDYLSRCCRDRLRLLHLHSARIAKMEIRDPFGILRRRGSEVEAVSQDSDKLVHDEDTYPKTVAPRCCGYCWPQSIHSWSTEPISKLRLSADTSCSSCKTRS